LLLGDSDVEIIADAGKILDENKNTIMSISSKKFCSPEDVEKRNSETTTNEKE